MWPNEGWRYEIRVEVQSSGEQQLMSLSRVRETVQGKNARPTEFSNKHIVKIMAETFSYHASRIGAML